MKTKSIILIVALVLCAVIVGCDTPYDTAEDSSNIFQKTFDGVTLTVELDKNTYLPDEGVDINVTVKNESNVILYCNSNNFYSGLAIGCIDQVVGCDNDKKLDMMYPIAGTPINPGELQFVTYLLPGEESVQRYRYANSLYAKDASFMGTAYVQWVWLNEEITAEITRTAVADSEALSEMISGALYEYKNWDIERDIIVDCTDEVHRKKFQANVGQEKSSMSDDVDSVYTDEYTNFLAVPFIINYDLEQ